MYKGSCLSQLTCPQGTIQSGNVCYDYDFGYYGNRGKFLATYFDGLYFNDTMITNYGFDLKGTWNFRRKYSYCQNERILGGLLVYSQG